MAELRFDSLSFRHDGNKVRVNFLKNYYFDIGESELDKIGVHTVSGSTISFEGTSEKSARAKFSFLLDKGFKGLKNRITGKDTIYIHQNSGIPLIGNSAFGIIDRNTTLVEVKPLTGCNLKCMFCSVDQSKRARDFVVEKDYLVDEFRKLAEFKGVDDLEVHINSHGEPLLYADLVPLVRDLAGIRQVKRISMDTNATMLSKKLADELIKAGLTSFNISLNSFDNASRMAGTCYNAGHVKAMCKYLSKKVKVIIAPVWVPGINDSQLAKLADFAKKNKAVIRFQKFLEYKYGKIPSKPISWDAFYARLSELEKEYSIDLTSFEGELAFEGTKKMKGK